MRLFLIALLLMPLCASSQAEKYWVYFRDKAGVEFDPYSYFDQKAIDRRIRENIDLFHASDFPLNEHYVNETENICTEICGRSRWFNAVACLATKDQIEEIKNLDFVEMIELMRQSEVVLSGLGEDFAELSAFNEQLLKDQTEVMQYSLFRQNGLTGKGVRIAVFDGGFKGFTTDNSFKRLIDNNQIRATYDFVRKSRFVFSFHNHGSHVMSCIAGVYKDLQMGCAVDAQFLLARTEQVLSENKIEEENWLESLEWADKNGADIINSSLGYTDRFYFRSEMDGKTSIISKAANLAASKGILVVNSAGNEGGSYWEMIAAPADADSVLTIGGINPRTMLRSDFSSYGPTSDKRMKPNLAAFGEAIGSSNEKREVATGTSFSSPLVTGFAACVRQLHPEWTVDKLFSELEKSGHLYPYFDYAHGYGIPQASYFVDSVKKEIKPTIQFIYNPDDRNISIEILSIDSSETAAGDGADSLSVDQVELPDEIKPADRMNRNNYVYVHGEGTDGVLDFYEVYEDSETSITIRGYWDESNILRAHYRGYTLEKKISELIETSEDED